VAKRKQSPAKVRTKPRSKAVVSAKRKSATTKKRTPTAAASANEDQDGSRQVEERIKSLADWRGELLSQVRRLIHEADPQMTEDCKWRKATNPLGVPVWSHAGIVCTGEAYKDVVKLTFAKGASLKDPQGLFNASLEGNARRAIDLRHGETPNASAFKALIKAAVAENLKAENTSEKGRSIAKSRTGSSPKAAAKGKVVLLSGGNPQIAKGDGDAPVQAYIAAMPGWKRHVGQELDELIVRTIPHVRKAVKWNSPFYGIEGQGWFLSFHVFTRYVKATFFRGNALQPIPPGGDKEARWLDIYEHDTLDVAEFACWIKQAAALPGWSP
jgi:hypothetical protein